MHGLEVFIGITNPSGKAYLFWSGFASDLGLLSAAAIWYKHHKCEHCLRLGHTDVTTHHQLCHRHKKMVD